MGHVVAPAYLRRVAIPAPVQRRELEDGKLVKAGLLSTHIRPPDTSPSRKSLIIPRTLAHFELIHWIQLCG